MNDLTGLKIDTITILCQSPNKGYWIGECSRCRQRLEYRAYELTHGITKHCKFCGDTRIERLEGKKFGEWEVLRYAGNRSWICKCSCGRINTVAGAELRHGRSKSCGHNRIANISGMGDTISKKYTDYIGKTIYNWKILEKIDGKVFKCQCLGCNRIYEREIASIIRGESTQCKSCGSLSKDDIIGKQINSWTVLKRDDTDKTKYICRCKCGREKSIRRYTLLNGLSKCCGRCNKTDIQISTFNDREALIEFISELANKLGRKPTSYEIASELSVNYNSLNRKIKSDFDIRKLLWNGQSQIEEAIESIVRKYCDGIKTHDRTILNGNELDIYIPSKNIAIEVNGSYWHSDIFKDSKYHQNKTIACINKGIRLIHIFEYEWINSITRDKIINFIIDNVNDNRIRIGARETQIAKISTEQTKEFMNKYHLQGYSNSTINLGLMYSNEIIGMMTFGKPRFNQNFDYEIIRLAFKPGYIIDGGTERLFKYFISEYHPKNVLTYANISKFYGNSYLRLGFKRTEITKPNYVWVRANSSDVLTRYQTQKQKLISGGFGSEDQTEDEIMSELGYLKIYDCGNYKFEYYAD